METSDFIDQWHSVVRNRDPSRLEAILADDVVFHSPVVHSPQSGKALTLGYLTAAMHVLGGEAFRYVEEWSGENSAVLEFVTEIDGCVVDGVDMIHWNDEGRIVSFRVFVRPLKAINLLHGLMAKKLAAAGMISARSG